MKLRDRGDAGIPQGPHAVICKNTEVLVPGQHQQTCGGDSGLQEAAGGRPRRHRWGGGGKSQQHLGTSHQHHHDNGSSSSTDGGESPDWRKLQRHQSERLTGCITAWWSSFPEPHQSRAGGSLRPTLQEESQLDYNAPTTPVTACFPSPQLLDSTEAWEPNWGPVLFHRAYDCWTLTPTVWQPDLPSLLSTATPVVFGLELGAEEVHCCSRIPDLKSGRLK